MTAVATLAWTDGTLSCSAVWRSSAGVAAPIRIVPADDTMTADTAFRLASEGTALMWRGDFQNARQLLQAMARRIDKPPRRTRRLPATAATMPAAFHAYRQTQSQRARTLGMLLIPLAADYTITLRRAPDVRVACAAAWGEAPAASGMSPEGVNPLPAAVVSLREILGVIGAYEWRKKGVPVAALGDMIHPHYGVFAPVRSEYLDLVANMPLMPTAMAFDIGTGTGVLAAVLAQRGVEHIIATDMDVRALVCARDNLARLSLDHRVHVEQADLFPQSQASLIVCNPPWLPARPSSPLEHAVYDPDSRMLRGFLDGLAAHLLPAGEGWLILSDLAEHLGLRSRATLLAWIDGAGLRILGRTDVRPHHPRVADVSDVLHAARAAEVTSLWRLGAA